MAAFCCDAKRSIIELQNVRGTTCPHGHDYDPFPEDRGLYALKVGIALIHINMYSGFKHTCHLGV
jgi:hypothetical protein